MKPLALTIAIGLIGCAHTQSTQSTQSMAAGGEASLSQRPAIAPLEAFAAPVPKIHSLKNGLKLYIVEKPGDGIEALQLVVRRGSAADPIELPGLASLAVEMLDTGSAGKSQTEMAAAADAIGAAVHAGAGLDSSAVSASAMAIRIEPLVKLLADVALRPNFADADWKRLLSQRGADLLAERAEPRSAAGHAFSRAIYGAHPYGRPSEGTVESVKAMKLEDAKAFFASFRPAESAIIAVGGTPEAQVVSLLTAAFEGWQGPGDNTAAAALAQANAPPAERPRLALVEFPGKPQTVMRVGAPGVPRSSPDVLALRLWNSILGGSFTSRLNQNLREKHSYTYGAGSGFAFGLGPGPFAAQSDVKTADTADALREMLAELSRALDEPVTDAELQKAKSLLAFNLVSALEHADGAATAFGQLFLYDLPPDEFTTFVPRLQKLTPADLREAARRALDPARMTIVLAGDRAAIEKQLADSKLGLPAPELRDVMGEPIPAK